ncbi:unnamed protein product [Linum trigynum]|uniref:Uncharacterized protein n=1 Tax=Linum trigynum TaxID=586398 RepID=A0AAV2DEW0_9ROSI
MTTPSFSTTLPLTSPASGTVLLPRPSESAPTASTPHFGLLNNNYSLKVGNVSFQIKNDAQSKPSNTLEHSNYNKPPQQPPMGSSDLEEE